MASNKTFTSITRVGLGAWLYSWTGTAPFRVLIDDVVVEESYPDTSYLVQGDDLVEPPVLEVCEQGETVDSEARPLCPNVQWFGNPRATAYNIYDGADLFDVVLEDGSGYYQAPLPRHANGTTSTISVKQVDSAGNESPAAQFSITMFKHPDPPSVSYTWDEDNSRVKIDVRS